MSMEMMVVTGGLVLAGVAVAMWTTYRSIYTHAWQRGREHGWDEAVDLLAERCVRADRGAGKDGAK